MALPNIRRPMSFLEQFSTLRDFDDIFRNFGRNWPTVASGDTLALDVEDEGTNYIVKVNAPGSTRKDFDLSFENGTLKIQYNHSEEKEDKGANYLVRERVMSSAARSVSLPLADANGKIDASLQDGVLTLTVPKTPEKQTKRIEIR